MGAPWIVHEGYVLVRPPDAEPTSHDRSSSPTRALHALATHLPHANNKQKLVERYVVLYMNRKIEFYDAAPLADATTATHTQDSNAESPQQPQRRRIGDALYVTAFAGWDGDGLLRVGDAYGLELKVDRKPHGSGRHTTSRYLAAFNRVDLERWGRALVAVLDPTSAAADDVRREHKRERKEAKRLALERDEKLRKWRELKQRELEDQREQAIAREEAISNMTPLERVDGLGTLDDDTARLLEKRKLRLQRRHALPTTGRMNKAAIRKRMDDGAGGKRENVMPLQPKVVETKSRVRVELPLPGQFIEATGVSSTHRIGLPHAKDPRGFGTSSSGSSSHETPSDTSSVSSNSHSTNGYAATPPPPPPPHALMMRQLQQPRSSFVPPPPPPRSGSGFVNVHNSSNATYDKDDDDNDDADRSSEASRESFATSRRRLSGVDREKIGVQDSLAAILSGRTSVTRRDSIDSSVSSRSVAKLERRTHRPVAAATEPPATAANAFAASLAAIRRNRADTIDDSTIVNSSPVKRELSGKVRTRTRQSQLSAEGKELLQQAIGNGSATVKAPMSRASNGRKGLFDDSDSDDADDVAVVATNKSARSLAAATSVGMKRNGAAPPTSLHSSNNGAHRSSARGFADDSSSDSDATDASRSEPSTSGLFAATKTTSSPNSTASSLVAATAPPPRITVKYVTSAVRPEGKKPAGFYTFALCVGALEHAFTRSYNELEALHLRLVAELPPTIPLTQLPKFPSKHRLRNNLKPENMHKRALECVAYLEQLVAVPTLATHARFAMEFGFDDRFAHALRAGSNSSNSASGSSADGVNGGRKPLISSPVVATSTTRTAAAVPAATKPAKSLFDIDDSSDDSSDSDASSVAPPSRVQPRSSAVEALASEPTTSAAVKPKTRKTSKREVVAAEPTTSSRRRPSSTASHASTASSRPPVSAPAAPTVAPPAAITGLPMRPNPFGGAGRGDLLAAIRNGAALKKVDPAAAAPPTAIGSAARTARPATAAGATAPAASISDAIANAMASRRIHIEYEDAPSDDDNSNDSDDDWD